MVPDDVFIGREKESAGAARRVTDRFTRSRRYYIDDSRDQRTRRKVLSSAGLYVLRVFLQQAFIRVALHVRAHHRPVFFVDQIDDQPTQLGRILELVLGFVEDQAEQALLITEFL